MNKITAMQQPRSKGDQAIAAGRPALLPPSALNIGAAFSLPELLLALGLGLVLSGIVLRSLVAGGQAGERLVANLQERRLQQRALALVESDLRQADRLSLLPLQEQHSCGMAGRTPVLHLSTSSGPITYSVGIAPSSIWRSQVLMRCGPAYTLAGELSVNTTAQNRVVLDGLSQQAPAWPECSNSSEELGGSARLGFTACLSTHTSQLSLRITGYGGTTHSAGVQSSRALEWHDRPLESAGLPQPR